MSLGVLPPHYTGLNYVLRLIGGGFRSGGGGGIGGVTGEGGAIAAWDVLSNEIGGLPSLQGVPLKVRRHP